MPKPLLDRPVPQAGNKPLLGMTPLRTNRAQLSQIPEARAWVFSLQFWQQIEFFEIGACEKNWFSSLLFRLTELSKMSKKDFEDDRIQDQMRYHPINWNSRAIPIQRSDLDWLASDYLNNEEEFPFYQVAISKALGRIIGFFDEKQIFNIVLLDPLHNMQPSKRNDYQIRPTRVGSCDYSRILDKSERLISKCQNDCPHKNHFATSIREIHDTEYSGVFVSRINPDLLEDIRALVDEGVVDNSQEVIEETLREVVRLYQGLKTNS